MNNTTIEQLRGVPVAGPDCSLLNLPDAHAPFFTRNITLITDSEGRVGLGEVPGGEAIRQTIEEARELLIGKPVAQYKSLLNQFRAKVAGKDVGGRGNQTFDQRI